MIACHGGYSSSRASTPRLSPRQDQQFGSGGSGFHCELSVNVTRHTLCSSTATARSNHVSDHILRTWREPGSLVQATCSPPRASGTYRAQALDWCRDHDSPVPQRLAGFSRWAPEIRDREINRAMADSVFGKSEAARPPEGGGLRSAKGGKGRSGAEARTDRHLPYSGWVWRARALGGRLKVKRIVCTGFNWRFSVVPLPG